MKKDNSTFLFLKWRVLKPTNVSKTEPNQIEQGWDTQLFSTGFVFITPLSFEKVWPGLSS